MRKVRFYDHTTLAQLGNFLKLDKFTLTYPKFRSDGMSKRVDLVNVDRGDAVAGLLHIVGQGRQCLLLVEQFRMPTLIDPDTGLPDLDLVDSDEQAGRMIELMAGMRKVGEPWQEAFRRECREETSFDLDQVDFIASVYPSPGACSEQLHIYYGRIDWPDAMAWPETDADDAAGFGDDTEDIRRHFVSPQDFLAMIADNRLKDAKAFVAAEWMRRPENMQLFQIAPAQNGHGPQGD